MTSSSFVFDEDDPPLLPSSVADRDSSSYLLPTGELDFEAFVDVSPPGGQPGGAGDDEMTDTVNMLDRIDTGSNNQGHKTKLIRILSTQVKHMCRGVIGGSNGLRFCTKHNCSVSSHNTSKVELASDVDRYYISGSRSSQAFTEPSVPIHWIRDESEQQILQLADKPVGVWKLFFKRLEISIKETDANQQNSTNFEVARELDNIEAAKETLKTPKRPTVNRILNMMASASKLDEGPKNKRPKLVRFKQLIKAEDSVEAKLMQLGLMLDQWNEIIHQVESLQSNFDKRTKDEHNFKEKLIDSVFNLQLSVNKAEDMGRLLNEEIGSSATELQGMTLWEGIEKLVYDDASVKQALQALEATQVTKDQILSIQNDIKHLQFTINKCQSWMNGRSVSDGKITVIEGNLIKFKEHYMKFYTQIKEVLLHMSPVPSSVAQTSGSFQFDQPGSNITSTNADVTNVTRRITNLEEIVSSLQQDLSDLQNSLKNEGSMNELEKISSRVKEIESRVSGDSCSINHGEYIFTSETEVATWLEREDVPTMGVFWDVFSVLVAMAPKRLTGKERADQQYSSDRINTTTAENELAASMAYERPQTLYGDKQGNLVPWEEGFGSCKTHDKWIIGTQSFKTVTTKQLKKFINGILGNLTGGLGGRNLARVLLNEVSRQWNEIVAFIDAFFQDLTETAHFQKQKAWLLVGQCCGAIFDAMEPYRAVVSQIEDLGIISSRAQFLWCVLQCHRVMNDFIAKDFRGHPQMVKQISLFMINERVDPVAFGKMETKVADQASTIDSLEKQVAVLKRTVGNHETFKKDISDLQRELKKKQDK